MRINALYIIIKLVERCNLNCSYCYYYTPENAEVYDRASLMSDELLNQIITYIDNAVTKNPVGRVVFGFHGGEPTLAKADRVRVFCDQARQRLEDKVEVQFTVQTNGVHVSDAWLKLIDDEKMAVGISIDGEKSVHDLHRVDHRGRGSYDRVCETLGKLLPLAYAKRVQLSALAVMGPEFTGLNFYKHLVEDLGIRNIKLLFPDRTGEMVPPDEELQALGRMLCEVFDHWLLSDRGRVEVKLFNTAVRGILASQIRKRSPDDGITIGFAVLSDGRVRIQDDFMIATDWFGQQQELFITKSEFSDYLGQPHLQQIVSETINAPKECQSCAFVDSCAGGEITHRYTRARGFNNRSVYCAALMMFYEHVDMRLNSGRAELVAQAASESEALILS